MVTASGQVSRLEVVGAEGVDHLGAHIVDHRKAATDGQAIDNASNTSVASRRERLRPHLRTRIARRKPSSASLG
jgi:hypothetical protein